jgi:hypothetical protein
MNSVEKLKLIDLSEINSARRRRKIDIRVSKFIPVLFFYQSMH